MNLKDQFKLISKRMLLEFQEAGMGQHSATKGSNREHQLKKFLEAKLPFQYGITSGEIVYRDGNLSPQTDTIIYDKLRCPILYSEASSIVPIDGTYGVIEVKSYLSKEELRDAALKVQNFKANAPQELAPFRRPTEITQALPGRPFGIVFGYSLKGNSLDSLAENWLEVNEEIGVASNWLNMLVVLGEGLLLFGKRIDEKTVEPFLETDALVGYGAGSKKRAADGTVVTLPLAHGEDTLMYFYFYLNALLARTRVLPVDIGRYVDSNLPQIIHTVL